MVPDKRKLGFDEEHGSRRMRLRFTQERHERGVKLQQTPKRANAFFTLPVDVRRLIYDHMALPPFDEAKSYSGFYLSCKQAKFEIDQAAPTPLRTYLLECQRKHSKDNVEVVLPKELETAPLPVHSEIDVTIRISPSDTDIFYSILGNIVDIAMDVHFLKVGRLHIHLTKIQGDRLDSEYMEFLSSIIVKTFLTPGGYFWETYLRARESVVITDFRRSALLRVKEIIVSWQDRSSSTNTPPEWMEGTKHEAAGSPIRRPFGYLFSEISGTSGARVIVIPQPFQSGGVVTREEMRILTTSILSPEYDVRISRATMEFSTFEIGDGPVLRERTRGPTRWAH